MSTQHLWLPYSQMRDRTEPLLVERTDGVRLRLADGRSLIDGIASWWTACHGYNHPHIRAAVQAQLERMPHVMLGGLAHVPALYARATARGASYRASWSTSSSTESGSVAVEVAMKIALQFRLQSRRARHEPASVAVERAYHGDTLAAMSVCDPEEGDASLVRRSARSSR